jgi:hypothetical protein
VLNDLRDVSHRDLPQDIRFVVSRPMLAFHFRLHIQDARLNLRQEIRLPFEFLDGLASPLAASIDVEDESFTLVRFDQQVGNGRRRVVDHGGVARRQHDGDAWMVSAQVVGQPQPGLSGHHDVDDGQVAVLRVQRRDGFLGG